MSLTGLRTSIIECLAEEIPQFVKVLPHGGQFNRDELRRIAVQAPSALVTVLGGPLSREGSQAVGDVQIAVFIVTGGTSTTKRDADALALAESVAGLVCQNAWDYGDAQAPMGMRIDNLYSGEIDKLGVALWSVSWEQSADLAIFDSSGLDDLITVNAKWDLAPADGVVDAEDQVEPRGNFMGAYGNLHVSTPVATAIAVAGTYQKLAGTTVSDLLESFDMPATGRLRYTGTPTRPCAVSASVSLTVSGDCKVTLAIAKNSTADSDTEIEVQMTSAGGARVVNLESLLSLAQNDFVEVWVKADQAYNVTATKATLMVTTN